MISQETWQLIKTLVQTMGNGKIQTVEVSTGKVTIRMSKESQQKTSTVSTSAKIDCPPVQLSGLGSEESASPEDILQIKSPTIGNILLAEDQDFHVLQIGDVVAVGQKLFTIRSVQIDTDFVATRNLVIVDILFTDNEAVDYDHLLLLVKLAEGEPDLGKNEKLITTVNVKK